MASVIPDLPLAIFPYLVIYVSHYWHFLLANILACSLLPKMSNPSSLGGSTKNLFQPKAVHGFLGQMVSSAHKHASSCTRQ